VSIHGGNESVNFAVRQVTYGRFNGRPTNASGGLARVVFQDPRTRKAPTLTRAAPQGYYRAQRKPKLLLAEEGALS
jgi:hypothetical protein